MKLSTKGRYASRAMLDLAIHFGEGPIMVKDIARRHHLSERYLEQLLLPLKAAGLVRGIRGAHGGFMLTRAPSEIKMLEILQIMEGSTAPVECVDNARVCTLSDKCVTRGVWVKLKKAIDGVLESITLEDLRAGNIKAEEVVISNEGCR